MGLVGSFMIYFPGSQVTLVGAGSRNATSGRQGITKRMDLHAFAQWSDRVSRPPLQGRLRQRASRDWTGRTLAGRLVRCQTESSYVIRERGVTLVLGQVRCQCERGLLLGGDEDMNDGETRNPERYDDQEEAEQNPTDVAK